MTTEVAEVQIRMHSNGLMYPDVFAGIQIDINAVYRTLDSGSVTEASVCGHNCTTAVGNYDCPAAYTLNKGVKKSTMAPGEAIEGWVSMGAAGLRQFRDRYLRDHFDKFCNKHGLTNPAVREALRKCLTIDKVEVNLFGGDPEIHPDVTKIIRGLKACGYKVNLTSTGRRWMTDAQFVEEILTDPPNVLAFSIDDLTVDEFRRISGLSLEDLRKEWKKIPLHHGQQQKAVEAVYVAKLVSGIPDFSAALLFNMVLWPGNIARLAEMTELIETTFPKTIVNPYPEQRGFQRKGGAFKQDDLAAFERFVDEAIEKTKSGARFVKRLHYWLLLKAILIRYRDNWVQASDAIAGFEAWQCWREPGAAFYLQIGRSSVEFVPIRGLQRRTEAYDHPGGHPGCYWNDSTVTMTEQVVSAEQIDRYLQKGMRELAHSRNGSGCAGCLMPRLNFNLITLLSGMDDRLKPIFLKLLNEHVGLAA